MEQTVVHDLTTLSTINLDVIVKHISRRYKENEIYERYIFIKTYIGDILIAVNPFKDLSVYSEEEKERYQTSKEPPHIYWISEQAVNRLKIENKKQCIVVSGDSGAGKTESTKHILSYLISRNDCYVMSLVDKLNKLNPLIEFFGNAWTALNINSSRFGKLVEISYGQEAHIYGGRILTFVLEKSRVVEHTTKERNFHAFHALFAGSSTEELESLYLSDNSNEYRIMRGSDTPMNEYRGTSSDETEYYSKMYTNALSIMKAVGFQNEAIEQILKILAACLLLGNIAFHDEQETGELSPSKIDYVTNAMNVLDIFSEKIQSEFLTALISKEVTTKDETVRRYLSPTQADDSRDALIKQLYACLFRGIIDFTNKAINGEATGRKSSDLSISILDISGFEDLQHNGFEQLFINITNEKIQQFYIEQIFEKETQDYRDENIDFKEFHYTNNEVVLDLILKKGGILSILDDQMVVPGTTDDSMVFAFNKELSSNDRYHQKSDMGFGISHYAGKVMYTSSGFLVKNRGTRNDRLCSIIKENTNNTIIKTYFDADDNVTSTDHSGHAHRSLLRSESISREIRAQDGHLNQMNVKDTRKSKLIDTCASQYKISLRCLIDRLAQGQPFFVRCIKPNDRQQSESFVEEIVIRQLKSAGILDVVKIRQEGFPKRLPFDTFKIRYKSLLPDKPGTFQQQVAETLKTNGITDFRIGRSKIFLKDEAVEQLDACEKINQDTLAKQLRTESLKRRNSNIGQKSRLPSIGEESPKPDECNETPIDDDTSSDPPSYTSNNNDSIKLDDDKGNTYRRAWDIFRITERQEANNENLERVVLKILRLMMFILLFICIMAKGTGTIIIPLMLASRLNNDKDEKKEDIWRSIAATQLMFCYCVPVALTFFTSFWKSLFGRVKCCRIFHMVTVIILECGHAVGSAVLMFKILPHCSTMTGVILSLSTMVFPAILNVRKEMIKSSKRNLKWKCGVYLAAILAVAIQTGSVIFIVPVHTYSLPNMNEIDWKYLVLGLTCFSLGYVENFIHGKRFDIWRHSVQNCRPKINIILCPMQVTIFISLGYIFVPDFQYIVNHPKSTNEIMNGTSLMAIYIICTILIKYEAVIACQLKMQLLSFYIALLLVPWSCFGLIQWQCQHGPDIKPFLEGIIVCHNGNIYKWIGLFVSLWLSLIMMTWHLFIPECHRMANQERLFVLPIRNSLFAAITLLLKRKDDFFEKETREVIDNNGKEKKSSDTNVSMETTFSENKDTKVPFVYICGTMWHETETEMLQLLKSMFRLDYDRVLRQNINKFYKFKEDIPDYFDFEIHIIFDDAFCVEDENVRGKGQKVLNKYVKQFISLIDTAASAVAKSNIDWDSAPIKTTTPYGGQLTWTLPAQSTLICHLKDKEKIRHRKRWSQIMYMYYLLGFKLAGDGDEHDVLGENEKKNNPYSRRGKSLLNRLKTEKAKQAHNTFILTLDGDVDFNPKAVELLLDKMKANRKTGAVCGRIHPIGSGPMVWYQEFEYAIGHWLQKATEHVFGCVLCCPGAFSLFRASAIMDDNVMRMYATPPTEAKHYIQFEQGEDRWLCTLMLQQGWRIDYAASADARTFAPETFKDFYIQRRRWAPSTLANVIDLLSSWRSTTKANDNLSTPFILYQLLLLASSLLGIGTVCLMIAGSINAVIKISIWFSFFIAITPVMFYVIVCFKCKNDKQILAAGILTCLYTIVMVIVTVGMLLNLVSEPVYSPNVIFIFEIVLVFIMSGICHPKEILCLVYGVLYYITVPSTFIVLTVYYMCNIHIVSWGTREGPKKPEDSEEVNTALTVKDSIIVSCFKSLGVMTLIQEFIKLIRNLVGRQSETDISVSIETNEPVIYVKPNAAITRYRNQSFRLVQNDDYWQTSPLLGNNKSQKLPVNEVEFWTDILNKYLHPLAENKEKQKEIADDLKSLRNNVALGFFLINFLFALAIMQLQVNEDQLKRFYILQEYEPMSVVFLFVFAVIIAIQFTGMLFHRCETFLHLISSIEVTYKKNKKDISEILRQKAGKLQDSEYDGSEDSSLNDIIVDNFDLCPDYPDEEETPPNIYSKTFNENVRHAKQSTLRRKPNSAHFSAKFLHGKNNYTKM